MIIETVYELYAWWINLFSLKEDDDKLIDDLFSDDNFKYENGYLIWNID